MPHLAPIADMNLNAAEKLMQVRLFAAMAAAKTLKKYDLLNPGGSIVLMSGSPYLKPYADWTAQASVMYGLLLRRLEVAKLAHNDLNTICFLLQRGHRFSRQSFGCRPGAYQMQRRCIRSRRYTLLARICSRPQANSPTFRLQVPARQSGAA